MISNSMWIMFCLQNCFTNTVNWQEMKKQKRKRWNSRKWMTAFTKWIVCSDTSQSMTGALKPNTSLIYSHTWARKNLSHSISTQRLSIGTLCLNSINTEFKSSFWSKMCRCLIMKILTFWRDLTACTSKTTTQFSSKKDALFKLFP